MPMDVLRTTPLGAKPLTCSACVPAVVVSGIVTVAVNAPFASAVTEARKAGGERSHTYTVVPGA